MKNIKNSHLVAFLLGMAYSAYMGLDVKNYTPERGRRLLGIFKRDK